MIICLEGVSAVGKTTVGRALQEQYEAVVIPEVNALFKRPHSAPEDWYLERQAERWNLALRTSGAHPLAVLDGDPFQPLWYNWSFEFQGLQSLSALAAFYRPLITDGKLCFPDVYFHLIVGKGELRRRRKSDMTRSRRNFDSHLRLIDTQRLYFSAMTALAPSLVQTVEAISPEHTLKNIEAILRTVSPSLGDPLALFDGLVDWLASNPVKGE